MSISASRRAYLAIEVGGTSVRTGLVSETLDLIAWRVVPTGRTGHAITSQLGATISELLSLATYELVGAGMAVAGLVTDGRLARDLRIGLTNEDLAGILASYSENAIILNDAHAQAIAEYSIRGRCSTLEPFVYAAFGTGIGGAVLLRGEPIRGRRGFAGGFGHMVIDPNGPVCGCGARGCFEALVGGEAIEKRYSVGLAAMLADHEGYADPIIDISRAISQAIATLCRIFDPGIVVLGGGAMKGYDILWPHVRSELEQFLSPYVLAGIRFECGRLGEQAGILGVTQALTANLSS